MNPIHIENLNFVYRGSNNKALNNISLDLQEGEMMVLMGRAGAGKSTLCQCLNGIVPKFQKGKFSGDIQIFGESSKGKHIYEIARNVGLVFQDFEPQLFSTSVELEVAFGPENIGLPRDEIADRIKYALRMVGLEGFEDRQPYNLSGGEKQRLAIASILSSRPRILVLDEPTTDLDPQGRYDIISALKALRGESISLILVEQDAEDVIDADRVMIMYNGRILVSGMPRDIFGDVELLEQHGIRPPQIAKLFIRKPNRNLPLTAKEAYNRFTFNFDTEELRLLQWEDEYRGKNYGVTALETKDLRHYYPDVGDVLTGVDVRIREGEFVAIIGQNGSGKTTLAKHFNGLLRPSNGSVLCFDRDTAEMSVAEMGRIVGYVFQNPDHQIFANTVRDELNFGPKNYGLPEHEIAVNVNQALEAVQLRGYEDRDPFSLTKGERQRVAVASVLSCKPKVLILDEPTTGLDYSQQRSMMELFRSLNSAGHTIIIITHALWVVAEYAHRAIVMHKGNAIMDGLVRKIFSRQDDLERVGLRVPEIIKLSNMFDTTLLSVDEYRRVIKK
jgi:energy-coupling factor transport system ATP-binding protein